MNIIIPTKNNPMGLCSLIGALLSQIPVNGMEPTLWLVDASDTPVLFHSHLVRLLTCLPFHYLRSPAGWTVNDQRIMAMDQIGSGKAALLDDDNIPLSGYYEALLACLDDRHPAIFGVTVDACNEKGYPDYRRTGDEDDCFAFTPGAEGFVRSDKVEKTGANIGNVVFEVELLRDLLNEATLRHQDPSVVDDAAALAMARKTGGMLHNGLAAWHIGNNNKNWGHPNRLKHTVVDQVAKGL